VYCVPKITDLEDYTNSILEIVESEEIDIIFPTLQDEIIIYRKLASQIKVKVALPSSDNFKILVDKESLYQYLEDSPLTKVVPKYFGFQKNDELEQLVKKYFADQKYVCVKPSQGHGGLGFGILTSRENYLQAIKNGERNIYSITDYCDIDCTDKRILMEYLDGPEYSVDILVSHGEIVVVVPRKRNRVSNGIVIEGQVVFNEELIRISSDVAKTLSRNGFLNLQFIESHQGYKLTDVNARFCGSQVMSLGAGVNFPYLFIQYNLLEQYVSVSPKWGTRMVRYWESCFFYD
jgi:carbamoyl-phosphate synthase large subunit